MTEREVERENKIVTVPNAMSAFRILLIPAIVWAYCWRRSAGLTMALLVLSGATDIADGYIARRFHMVSNLGKILNPVADKLTQGVILLCLLTRFPAMAGPLAVLIVKEGIMAVSGLVVIRKTGEIHGAVWHGKVTTWLLYGTAILHAIWPDIPKAAFLALIFVCTGFILLSLVLYSVRNWRLLRAAKTEREPGLPEQAASGQARQL
ncbi:MAG: CDP-alcohol phosphatidyltransferase family protein [Oscillospiraceae bacterium]|nr:CDP-alcohol phosphatidyltransferase family protein [Oscillospiraceae bacterium]